MFLIGLFIVCFSLPITIRMYQILYLANFSPDPDIRLVYSWQFNIDRLTVVALLFTALTVFGILLMVIGLIAKKKIARTTIQVSYTNPEETQRSVSELLRKKGYKNIIKNNESIWKCGVGFLTAIKYIKIEFTENNTMLISGWIRPLGGSEQNLDGVVCIIPKKQVQSVVNELQGVVR